MPAQTPISESTEYGVGDTAPPLRVQLLDGDKEPIDLTSCTVVINIAWATYSYYYSPMDRLVNEGAVIVDPDQSEEGNRGWVDWFPQPDDLDIAGSYRYQFQVTFPDLTIQTVAPDAVNTLIVRPPIGGMQFAGGN